MRCFPLCCVGTLGAFEAAEVALRILHALVQGRAAADASGRPLLPLPRVRRQLASPACLPHLAQARPRLRSCLTPCPRFAVCCWPPVRRQLASPACLPHLAQARTLGRQSSSSLEWSF